MLTVTLIADAATWLLAGAALVPAAAIVARRAQRGGPKVGHVALATWWGGIAATNRLSGVFVILVGFGAATPSATLLLMELAILAYCAALWGLTAYLVVLRTGSTRDAAALSSVFTAMAALLFYVASWLAPSGGSLDWAGFVVAFERGMPLNVSALVALLFAIPAASGVVVYARLLPDVEGRMPRYRLVLVACAWAAWALWAILFVVIEMTGSRSTLGGALSTAARLVVPLVTLAAYAPPGRVRAALSASPA